MNCALARASANGSTPACFRRLRQRDQQSCLAEREPARLLAEIGKRCGAHAFEIAAKRGEAQVEIEHLILAERVFNLNRAHHLPQLAAKRTRVRFEQARDLHGQG